MAGALVITLSGITGSAAPGTAAESSAVVYTARPRSQACPDARRAIAHYRTRYVEWRRQMSASTPLLRGRKPRSCRDARYLADVWRVRALQARREYEEWYAYHWDWSSWLPDKWQRIGACETGYGQRPGNWQHNSGTYQGAFGFHHQSWDAFVPYASRRAGPYPSEAYLATPRQQYEVALAIWRRYGFSGWGCRGA